jgi:sugar phosphate permease
MKNLLRALLAGWGAKKIGGGKCGCIGTIFVFLILFWLLGFVFDMF